MRGGKEGQPQRKAIKHGQEEKQKGEEGAVRMRRGVQFISISQRGQILGILLRARD